MKAMFNNEERELHISREHVPFLEHSLGRGLYAVLKDFTAGAWTFDDVATVISFALHGPAHDDKQAITLAAQSRRLGFPAMYGTSYRPHPDVVSVLQRDGHGNFAPLAADVLTYTIFGEQNVESDAA